MRQRCQIVRAEDHIKMRELFRQLIAIALADASTYRYNPLAQRGPASHGDVLQRCNLTVQTSICRFTHAARHVNQDIGFLHGVDHKAAETFEHARNTFGVMLVHLASEGPDAKSHIHEWGMHKDTVPIESRIATLCEMKLLAKSGIGDWRAVRISRLHGKANGRPVFAIDHDVGK